MSAPPSSALAGAAVAGAALAARLATLAGALPLPAPTALSVTATCRRLAEIDAPRLAGAADVAALARALIRTAQGMARDAAPADAAAPLFAAAAEAGQTYPTSASVILTRSYRGARVLACSVEAALLGEAFLAEACAGHADRAAAAEARARIAAGFEGVVDRLAEALGQRAVGTLRAAMVAADGHLVTRASTLQPLMRLETARSFPSTRLAWALYRDPARAAEIVARNRVATPLFCPPVLEVVAPKT